MENNGVNKWEDRLIILTKALVRPIVTIQFSTAVVLLTYAEKISTDAFMGLAGAVIAFWFKERLETEKLNVNERIADASTSTSKPII